MENITVLAIGDPHFKISNIRETDRMVEAIVNLANKRIPDIIVVLGDVLDRHEAIHVSPLSRSVKFLSLLMKIAPTYVLIGNHDLKNNRQFLSTEHPFVALKLWGERIVIVDTVIATTIKGYRFVFVPYVPPGRFVEALNTTQNWERATCIFAHQEFKGAKMEAITSIEGDNWPLTFPLVVSGHIHDYQEPQKNILYPGTPIQHSFNDSHNKTVSYLTFYSSGFDQQRVSLGLPRKRTLQLTCAEVSSCNIEYRDELKIIISGVSGDIKAIMKHPNIAAWERAGYKVVYKDTPLQAVISHAHHVKYSSLLYEAVRSNSQLEPLYNNILGKPTLTLRISGST